MTTAAMVVAMVPLLIAKGAGAASRFDIGVVIAAGMTIGTIFTLFVTPAVYTFLAKDYQKARAREAEHGLPTSEEAPAATGADLPAKAAAQDAQAEAVATLAEETPARKKGIRRRSWLSARRRQRPRPEKDKGRKGGRKPPKRKPLNPAAE